jgi:cytochrome c-type biogenesis protein CcmF
VLGVIASSAFSRTLADPGRENFVVERGQSHTVDGYRVSYVGREETPRGHTRYLLDVVDPKGRAYTVQPVAYQNKSEQWIQHPDVKQYAEQDLFVAVSPNAMFETGTPEAGGNSLTLGRGASASIGDEAFTVLFTGFDINVSSELVPDSAEIAVAAVLEITNRETDEVRALRPIYLVMPDGSQQFIQNRIADWDLTVTFVGMYVETGEANFMVDGVDVVPEDWVVVQAYEKPLIGLVWIGIFLLSIGMVLSIVRRASEYRFALVRSRA